MLLHNNLGRYLAPRKQNRLYEEPKKIDLQIVLLNSTDVSVLCCYAARR